MNKRSFSDSLGVRESTSFVVDNSKFVFINQEKIDILAKEVKKRIDNNEVLDQWQFGKFKKTPQHIFIMDAVNFCFWAKKNEDKWRIEYPKDNVLDGWKALVACFDRTIEEKIPITDCDFLENITLEQTKNFFRNCNNVEIPLLIERMEFLRESGKILKEKFCGDFTNLIKQADYDAIKIAKTVIENFPSFRDTSVFLRKQINFYKRAQILVYDISLLKNIEIKNIDKLTAFADYKLPQVLRDFKVLTYSKGLADKVDNYTLLEKDSQEEIEIRSSMIQACDLIAEKINVPAVTVENAIWSLSQTHIKQYPYHRVLTTNY